MTSLVLGAAGIIGQHMRLQNEDAKFVRQNPGIGYIVADLSRFDAVKELLEKHRPTTIVNLAGMNDVNTVERQSHMYTNINIGLVWWLAEWCDNNNAHLIQVSTQAVFDGNDAPYRPDSKQSPYLLYGAQKAEAERIAWQHTNTTVARVTFVLGVRPNPNTGRLNPLEAMFRMDKQLQVNDRWMSVSFAKDVAEDLWKLVATQPVGTVHLGIPERVCRYDIAKLANPTAQITTVSDDDFGGPRRPLDTTWAHGSLHRMSLIEGIEDARKDWEARNG